MVKKFICQIVAIVCSVVIVLVLILTSIEIVAFDRNFYMEQYRKNDTAHIAGATTEQLLGFTDALLLYLKGGRSDLYIRWPDGRYVFSGREIEHMKDVRQLFVYGVKLRNIGLFFVIVLISIMSYVYGRIWTRYLSSTFIAVFAVTLLMALLIGVGMMKNFDLMWDRFHHIFFTNDLWILDPSSDILIMMMPGEFFISIIKVVAGYFVIGMGFLFVTSLLLYRGCKK